MKFKMAVSIIVLLPAFAGLLFFREGLPNRAGAPQAAEDDLLKRLNIGKVDEKTPAADFTLKDLDGNKVSLRDFRGRVVFLNFWATWCPSCRLEMPEMEELHREFGNQGLVVLAINFREGPQEIRTFLKQHRLTFTTLLDKEERVFELYKAWSLPTTYLINKNGEILGKVIGYRDWYTQEARAFFRHLLENKS